MILVNQWTIFLVLGITNYEICFTDFFAEVLILQSNHHLPADSLLEWFYHFVALLLYEYKCFKKDTEEDFSFWSPENSPESIFQIKIACYSIGNKAILFYGLDYMAHFLGRVHRAYYQNGLFD